MADDEPAAPAVHSLKALQGEPFDAQAVARESSIVCRENGRLRAKLGETSGWQVRETRHAQSTLSGCNLRRVVLNP